jgi:hypothetical protein
MLYRHLEENHPKRVLNSSVVVELIHDEIRVVCKEMGIQVVQREKEIQAVHREKEI